MTNVGSEVSLSRLELIVLARLSSTTPPSPKELGEAVQAFALPNEPPGRAREIATEVHTRLHQCALVADRGAPKRKSTVAPKRPSSRKTPARKPRPPQPGNTLTDDGRRALCKALNTDVAPTWDEIRDVHLPALAIGLRPDSEEARRLFGRKQGKKSKKSDGAVAVAAAVLRNQFSIQKAATITALADALIAEALGLPPGPVTLSRLRAHVIARRAGVEAKGKPDQIAVRVAAKTLRARGADKRALVQALARGWASASTGTQDLRSASPSTAEPMMAATAQTDAPASVVPAPRALPEQPLTADELLRMVHEAISTIGADGRFGPEKVFVSAIWHRLERDRRLLEFSLDRFKRWLVIANRDRLLDLARADLVGAMDPRQVAESEIEDLGTTFHFVLDHRVVALESERRAHAR